MFDFEIQRCTRECAATGQPLTAGETFHSVLVPDGAEIIRKDYKESAWTGPPPEALGWWKSQMPSADAKKPRLAPNQILLDLFLRWQGDDSKADIRYVLALLLIRRRVVRVETPDKEAAEELVLFCPRNGETYRVAVSEPTAERVTQIQAELGELLFAKEE